MHFRRTASKDTEIGGEPVKEGDKVVFWHISANRDETVFDDPYTFDINRHPNEHIAFGAGGPHFCLGANLARAELQEAFAFLAPRMRELALDGEPVYDTPLGVYGLRELRLSFARG